ncbi:hypothetical protein COLO4_04185 [Corchorus olitorius]|uniref:Uncharacterized protein n=1 Tax=Corchorus olitorius TaxID=93759 RepID=A0A1R3KV34_9ROSI|nr:hypothetical protein COLO4_04185 [Corchorus olitorius]
MARPEVENPYTYVFTQSLPVTDPTASSSRSVTAEWASSSRSENERQMSVPESKISCAFGKKTHVESLNMYTEFDLLRPEVAFWSRQWMSKQNSTTWLSRPSSYTFETVDLFEYWITTLPATPALRLACYLLSSSFLHASENLVSASNGEFYIKSSPPIGDIAYLSIFVNRRKLQSHKAYRQGLAPLLASIQTALVSYIPQGLTSSKIPCISCFCNLSINQRRVSDSAKSMEEIALYTAYRLGLAEPIRLEAHYLSVPLAIKARFPGMEAILFALPSASSAARKMARLGIGNSTEGM